MSTKIIHYTIVLLVVPLTVFTALALCVVVPALDVQARAQNALIEESRAAGQPITAAVVAQTPNIQLPFVTEDRYTKAQDTTPSLISYARQLIPWLPNTSAPTSQGCTTPEECARMTYYGSGPGQHPLPATMP
jgi:hypothetical protein